MGKWIPPQRAVESLGFIWSFISEGTDQGVSLGYRFTVDVPGWIVQAGFLQSIDDVGAHAAYLVSPAHQLLRVTAWLPEQHGGPDAPWTWVRRNIKPAWRVEPGNVYQWMVWRQRTDYAYIHNKLDDEPLVHGHITIVQNNFDGASSAGLFHYDAPFQTDMGRGEGTLYGVDMGFQPESE